MKKVGYAAQQPHHDGNTFESGFLKNTFSQGGVSEVTLHQGTFSMHSFERAEQNLGHAANEPIQATSINHTAEVLYLFEHNRAEEDSIYTAEMDSAEHLLRREHDLGHRLESAEDAQHLHQAHTADKQDFDEHHVFEYSRKETSRENNGGTSDDNIITDTGHLKRGIMNPDAHSANRKKTDNLQRFVMRMNAQEQYMLQLEERIQDLQEKIDTLNEEIEQIEEAQDLLAEGDINDDTADGASRRRKVEAVLKKNGQSLDDFRKEDGSIDQDAVAQQLDTIHIQKTEQVQEHEDDMQSLREEHMELNKDKTLENTPDHLSAVNDDNIEYNGANFGISTSTTFDNDTPSQPLFTEVETLGSVAQSQDPFLSELSIKNTFQMQVAGTESTAPQMQPSTPEDAQPTMALSSENAMKL